MITVYRLGKHIGIKIRAEPDTTQRRALRLAILLDVSASMSGARLSAVQRTLEAARPLWNADDRVTLVTFQSEASLVLKDHIMDAAGLEVFYTTVNGLVAGGCTNLGAGLEVLASVGYAADQVLLLTDGVVTRGTSSLVGLRTMALGLGATFTNLGYGNDINHTLLRDLAVRSRGAFTVCNSEEVLPIVIGSLISELRMMVCARATVSIPDEAWVCQELAGADSNRTFTIGAIAPDRDYWVVYEAAAEDAATPTVQFVGSLLVPVTPDAVRVLADTDEEAAPLKENILRAQVVAAMDRATSSLTSGGPISESLAELRALAAQAQLLVARPLTLRMRGELATTIEQLETAPIHSVMSRLTSNTAYLSTQRGTVGADDDFSSPCVRESARRTQVRFTTPGASDPMGP